jgi:tight adherence protein B
VVPVTAVVVVLIGSVVAAVLATVARRAPAVDRARRLRTRSGLPIPGVLRDRIAGALARADVDLVPDDAVRLWLLGTAVGAGLAAALHPIAAVPVGLAVLVGASLGLWWARGRADARVVGALPSALDRVSAGLRAGATVGDSLGELAAASGPLAPDLRRLAARSRLGVGLGEALAQWAHERPLPGVQAVSGALALAVSVGGACAVALEGLGESLRAREATTREAHALSAQARLSAVVVGAAPLGYLGFVSITDPGSLDALLSTGAGRMCLIVGLALEALGALWMRALLRRQG